MIGIFVIRFKWRFVQFFQRRLTLLRIISIDGLQKCLVRPSLVSGQINVVKALELTYIDFYH